MDFLVSVKSNQQLSLDDAINNLVELGIVLNYWTLNVYFLLFLFLLVLLPLFLFLLLLFLNLLLPLPRV